mmetsp:Transcript_32852/g.83147  ORF Transcript_32852/g.83147 Transcript_32852/m.83147 type:complete len:124 (+) Transcript_32852:580-951(+)
MFNLPAPGVIEKVKVRTLGDAGLRVRSEELERVSVVAKDAVLLEGCRDGVDGLFIGVVGANVNVSSPVTAAESLPNINGTGAGRRRLRLAPKMPKVAGCWAAKLSGCNMAGLPGPGPGPSERC